MHYRVLEHAGSLESTPHLRTLAQEKRSEIVFVLGLVGGVSVSIHYCREISEYIFPHANNGRSREKKNSGKAI